MDQDHLKGGSGLTLSKRHSPDPNCPTQHRANNSLEGLNSAGTAVGGELTHPPPTPRS